MASYICRVCKKPLTNPKSVELGIGPDCLRQWGATESDSDVTEDQILLPFNGDIVFEIINGKRATNVRRQIVKHSPTGFAWGYEGSGPADLALNALLLYTNTENAFLYYQRFKAEFISAIPKDGGKIEGTTIKSWLKEATKHQELELV